jgi:selT/selW/selH-like putative selenoprotein
VKAWIESHGHGPVEIQQGKTGQFDVVVDGRVVYSRYETGRFPSEADLAKLPF